MKVSPKLRTGSRLRRAVSAAACDAAQRPRDALLLPRGAGLRACLVPHRLSASAADRAASPAAVMGPPRAGRPSNIEELGVPSDNPENGRTRGRAAEFGPAPGSRIRPRPVPPDASGYGADLSRRPLVPATAFKSFIARSPQRPLGEQVAAVGRKASGVTAVQHPARRGWPSARAWSITCGTATGLPAPLRQPARCRKYRRPGARRRPPQGAGAP